jgi:ubiquinone/menaquinone biosynthesis C-methylase UbiE
MSRAYIHGYSVTEQRRLIQQATVLANNLYAGLDLRHSRRLLELGCGAGAELAYLRAHNAGTGLVGVDISAGHLAAARHHLTGLDPQREITLVQADAAALPFPGRSFDTVMTVWMLEHAARPLVVMAEALRVLADDGRLICTEVDNATLRVEPGLTAIDEWLAAFNRFQQETGGDPYIGRRLTQMARQLDARDIHSETLPILSSQREPHRRVELANYLESLLLSAREALAGAGTVQARQIHALRADFDRLRQDPTTELRYFAVRMTCRPPP